MQTTTRKPDKEVLTTAQRLSEPIAVVVMLLLFAFFVYHQTADTGFFTDKFGPAEMFFLYGPMLLSAAAPLVRMVTGRRNPARPLEVVTNAFLAIGAFWLLMVFPFDFTHLADALPGQIQFLLSWVTDDIGRIVLILQIVAGAIIAIATTWKYASVRGREHATPSHWQPS
jgi:hypothetical protein